MKTTMNIAGFQVQDAVRSRWLVAHLFFYLLVTEALAGLARYAEAESLLVDSYTVLSSDATAIPMFVSQARERLVSMYEAWGRPEKAAEIPTLDQP